MSHHTSPQSPTRTRLRARPGVVGTPGSSGLPASLLRFVSPASLHNDADSFEPKGGWDVVRLALGLRDSGPPPGGVFTSARSSPQCSTASCDAGNDEDEDEDEDDEDNETEPEDPALAASRATSARASGSASSRRLPHSSRASSHS